VTLALGAIILAAGAGTRLGNVPKCLIRVHGRTLLDALLDSLDALEDRQPDEVVLVLGHHAGAIEQALRQRPVSERLKVAHNPQPTEDPAGSLHTGLRALSAHLGTVVVLLADQPLLGAADLTQALQAFDLRAPGQRVMLPQVNGQPGHPVVMERSVASELLSQGIGLRDWRLQHPHALALWNTTNTHYTCDLDTAQDLEHLRQRTGWDWQAPTGVRVPPAPVEQPD